MILEMDSTNSILERVSIPIDVNCLAVVDDRVYLCPETYNQLYVMDIKDGKVRSLGRIPWENEFGSRLYEKMVRVNRTLYFLPFRARFLSTYDIESGEFGRIDIRENKWSKAAFVDGFYSNDYLYLIGGLSSPILRVGLRDFSVEELKNWGEESRSIIFEGDKGYFRSQGVLVDDCFITPFMNANALLVFYFEKMDYKIIHLSGDKNGYSGIVAHRDCYWLSPRRGGMYAVKCDENFRVQERICFGGNDAFTGVDIVDESPVFYYSGGLTEQGGDDCIRYNTTRISVGDGYMAYLNNQDKIFTVGDSKGIKYKGEIRIQGDIDEAMKWAHEYRNKTVTIESESNSLEFYLMSL